MVADTKPSPYFIPEDSWNPPEREDILCVECGHDTSWHFASRPMIGLDREAWEYERDGTWDGGRCQWDDTEGTSLVHDPDPDDLNKCRCEAFKHPDAPRRREAIEHSRSKHG
jgi:hypothetical protein